MLEMDRKIEPSDRNIDLEAIARWANEGGASGAVKRGAERPRLHDALGFRPRHRRQQLASSVADTRVNVSHDGGKNGLALCKSAQAAQGPRRENLAARVSYDLWRFSCEMPDAPHLHDNSPPL